MGDPLGEGGGHEQADDVGVGCARAGLQLAPPTLRHLPGPLTSGSVVSIGGVAVERVESQAQVGRTVPTGEDVAIRQKGGEVACRRGVTQLGAGQEEVGESWLRRDPAHFATVVGESVRVVERPEGGQHTATRGECALRRWVEPWQFGGVGGAPRRDLEGECSEVSRQDLRRLIRTPPLLIHLGPESNTEAGALASRTAATLIGRRPAG